MSPVIRKPSLSAGAAYSPRRAARPSETTIVPNGVCAGRSLVQWIKRRLSEHLASSIISTAFTLGGLLMLAYFYQIKYLPSIDLKSATGLLLGVAMAGAITLGSIAILLGAPGALLQLCVRYKILNPGTENLDIDLKTPERKKRKGNGRGAFVAYTYIAEILALTLLLGPSYLGLNATFFGWSTTSAVTSISWLFMISVGVLALQKSTGGVSRRLRVRYKHFRRWTHGLWILAFLTLFLTAISAFLFQIFPFFQQEDDFISLLYFGLAISISCAFGIAIRHSWKSALIFSSALLLAFLFWFGGLQPFAAAIMHTLKLGNLENVVILASPSACQTIAAIQESNLCEGVTRPANGACRISGLTILSRVGEESLLAFKAKQSDVRFTLRSSEIVSIAYADKKEKEKSPGAQTSSACVRIIPVLPAVSSESKP